MSVQVRDLAWALSQGAGRQLGAKVRTLTGHRNAHLKHQPWIASCETCSGSHPSVVLRPALSALRRSGLASWLAGAQPPSEGHPGLSSWGL